MRWGTALEIPGKALPVYLGDVWPEAWIMRKMQACGEPVTVSGERSSKWHDSDALSVLGAAEWQQGEQGGWRAAVKEGGGR